MNKNKPISMLFVSLLLLSLLAIYTPAASGGTFKAQNQNFYGTITPQVVTAGYDGKEVKFQFSLTSNTTTGTAIDRIDVTLPTGWGVIGAECNETWTATPDAGYVRFTATVGSELVNGTRLLFNITTSVLVGTGEWTIECFDEDGDDGAESLGSVTKTVLVTPYFDAQISPAVVKSNDTYVFVLTITHNTTLSSIYEVAVQYPSTVDGWVFRDIVSYPQYWVFSHNTGTRTITFTATGGNLITPGSSAIFSMEMRLESGASDGTWSVTAENTATQQATISLTVDVDDVAPTISIATPINGARVRGSVWINATIIEDYLQSWAIKINGTQVATGTNATIKYSWNTQTYTDGLYTINITATDVVGNIGHAHVNVTVDNTAPQFLEIKVKAYRDDTEIGEYTPIGNNIWIPNATGIRVNATFYDAGTISGHVYFNVTPVSFSNKTWLPTENPYNISGVAIVPVTINITDDLGNRFVGTWYVRKDLNPPSAPTYTRYQLICGGIIIWGINATDAESAVVGYNVYINGTSPEHIEAEDLASETWQQFDTRLYAFSGALVVDLSEYAGKPANITLATVDWAGNERAVTIYVGAIPSGTWYPIELERGWNLISLPLVPNSTIRADIYALILKQGAAGVTFTYGFDNQAKQWILNPPTLTHGKGYWLYLNGYDVLIVQGTLKEEYWGLEPIYYLLYRGWNLVGYTETDEYSADWYLSSLQENTYFRYLFIWDAQKQKWCMVDTNGVTPGTLEPGQAFWILLYEDQILVPPIPTPP